MEFCGIIVLKFTPVWGVNVVRIRDFGRRVLKIGLGGLEGRLFAGAIAPYISRRHVSEHFRALIF